MGKIRKAWLLIPTAAAVVVLGVLLSVPTWAAGLQQGDGPSSAAFGVMHASCEAGDVQGMTEAMDALTDEDWKAMAEHMATHMVDGHHGAMGGQMMGSGGMMGAGMGMMGGVMGR